MSTTKSIKTHNRILEISEDAQQITMPDSRYYRRNGAYYPSITHVLGCYPKSVFFENWLKKVGYAADYILKKAGEEGTEVHDLIDRYLNKEELNFLLVNGRPAYSPDVWQMFLRFVDFWEEYKPTLIETEVHLFSDEIKVAGTCDLVCLIDGKRWIIDYKTSNHISSTYELQTAVYGKCYEECFNEKIDKFGILWLKSSKRKASKKKMQGNGWEMILNTRTFEENIDIFKNVKSIFDLENPSHAPKFTTFRTKVQL